VGEPPTQWSMSPQKKRTKHPRSGKRAAAKALTGGLREQDLLRVISDRAPIGVYVVDRDRRYAFANAAYSRMLHLPEDLVGRRLEDVLAQVYEAQVLPRLDRAFAGEHVTYELHRSIADGDRHFAVSMDPSEVDGVVDTVVVLITDITDPRRSQTDSSRLAAIVESSADAMISKDLDGVVTSWNESAEKIFGYTAAEMVGTSILRLIPEHLRHEEERILAQVRRGERVEHLETRRRKKGGEMITVSVSTSPLRDASGRLIGASKVARDITAQKRAEEERRFQHAMLVTERELTLDGILAVDVEGNVLSYNGRFAAMWGVADEIRTTRADEKLLQSVIHKLLHPESFMTRVQELYERPEESSSDEIDLTDGRTFERYSAPMRMDGGRYYGRIWYFRDVTERKAAETALRVERDRAQRYLDTAQVMLLALDREGRVTSINQEGCRLLGWSEAELLGRNWIETCLPPRLRDELQRIFDQLQAGDTSVVENSVLTRAGEERLIEWRNRVLRDNGGAVIGTFSSGTDITERRRLEDQYHQAQKMEAVGRLAGGVAHDFNNLLTAILGYCQLLISELGPGDPRLADVMEIHKAGESAAGLTRQLLAFSRKQIIEPTVLDVNEVTGGLQGMLGRLIGEDVQVVMKLPPETGRVEADRGQLEQIVLNLAVNARDAMPAGGTLTIETANVELDEDYASSHFSVEPGPYVALRVSDTGSGMPPDVQARLFEPFFTTKEAGKGTGLGLATVHGIVLRAGGSIGVYSELDRGTTFAVYLPRVTGADVVAKVARPVAGPRATGERVLVVEDAEGLRALARRMLERRGYSVVLAGNVREALKRFEEDGPIDVVLTDVVMPGGSGPDLVAQLVAQRPALKVIYMSGYTEDAITHHGVLDPGVAFLHKPFTAESLDRKIREVLEG
jgi:two-component system, cell cycle sensor histidine kinase and response regulator CckA